MTRFCHKITILFLLFTIGFFTVPSVPTVSAETQAELEQQLKDIEKQIADFEKQLTVTTKEKQTLTTKVKQLKIKQQELQALIKQTTIKVNTLATTIKETEKDLNEKVLQEATMKDEIAETIRLVHQKDLRPLMLLASGKGLSHAFVEVYQYASLTHTLHRLVDQVQELQDQIEKKKDTLEGQKDDAQHLLKLKTIQNQELASSLTEQNSLLTKTKGEEAAYQASLADSKKRAAEIRNRIYELFNTGKQINFGEAVEIANYASKQTGVRAAFLLAILTQESNLGKNVGTCNRAGDPPEKSWKVVMKPTRDQEPFLAITKELGLDPDTTPVSCPMKNKDGSQLGWGGAMGPAQFIPSTWVGYKDKVAALTGKKANPWDIRDAFLAAGIKLGSQGAKTKEGEWKAAMLYFSGSTNLAYRFYGDNVVATANKYQIDIDALK